MLFVWTHVAQNPHEVVSEGMRERIATGTFKFHATYWKDVSDDAMEVMPMCHVDDAMPMCHVKLILPHIIHISALTALQLVEMLLVVNPKQRMTVQQLLAHPWMNQDVPPQVQVCGNNTL